MWLQPAFLALVSEQAESPFRFRKYCLLTSFCVEEAADNNFWFFLAVRGTKGKDILAAGEAFWNR